MIEWRGLSVSSVICKCNPKQVLQNTHGLFFVRDQLNTSLHQRSEPTSLALATPTHRPIKLPQWWFNVFIIIIMYVYDVGCGGVVRVHTCMRVMVLMQRSEDNFWRQFPPSTLYGKRFCPLSHLISPCQFCLVLLIYPLTLFLSCYIPPLHTLLIFLTVNLNSGKGSDAYYISRSELLTNLLTMRTALYLQKTYKDSTGRPCVPDTVLLALEQVLAEITELRRVHSD